MKTRPLFHLSARRHWLAGLALAALGVGLARLLAPAFSAQPRSIVALAGQLVALAGLVVIARGVRLRIEAASAVESSPSLAAPPRA